MLRKKFPRWIGLCFMMMYLLCGQSAYSQNSPYMNRVYEYMPAPGQFVNTIPEYEKGDDAQSMCKKCEDYLVDNAQGMVSLGAFGGYIVIGFDHTIVNVAQVSDFRILGNAFFSSSDLGVGGSCEPGVIWVSRDVNGNHLPDDPWYEIAGSEYHHAETIHNYQLTYELPSADHVATPDLKKMWSDMYYIKWTDNQGEEGYVPQNTFHTQAYYPLWLNKETYTFEGTRLPNNGVQTDEKGLNYFMKAFEFGYADNYGNKEDQSAINIEWAVDGDGNPANLEGVDFIRVQTGVNQVYGVVGESSTEITGAEDLHPSVALGINDLQEKMPVVYLNRSHNLLMIEGCENEVVTVFNLSGNKIFTSKAKQNRMQIPVENWSKGVYLINIIHKTYKISLN